jgi:hypothetical protein
VFSLILALAYFVSEMFHYGMFRINGDDWKREWSLAACGLLLAILVAVVTYCAAKCV